MSFRQVSVIALLGCVAVGVICGDAVHAREPSKNEGEIPGRFVPVESLAKQSMRGVCVASEKVVWASGAGGTVLKSVDAGETWQYVIVPDAEAFDFRDVHAFDERRVCLMVAGSPARIYYTEDGGENWTIAIEDKREGAFFDAMEFWDDQNGIAFGDAIDGRLVIARTSNGGKKWELAPSKECPKIEADEHGFAASGSCLEVFGERGVMIGLGGGKESKQPSARVLKSLDRGESWTLSYSGLQTEESAGVFSIEAIDEKRFVAVGGDYTKEGVIGNSVSLSEDAGESWTALRDNLPSGYRSAVKVWKDESDKTWLVTAGPNGVDVSSDLGKTWQTIRESRGYHAIDFSKDGKLGWAVGAEGRMGKWVATPDDTRRVK